MARKITPLGRGLVNQTYLIRRGGTRFVLQRLNPVFSAAVNKQHRCGHRRLAELGMETPRLVPTRDGGLSVDMGNEAGLWRLQTYVDGVVLRRGDQPGPGARCGFFGGAFPSRARRARPRIRRHALGASTIPPSTWPGCARRWLSTGTNRLYREVDALAADLLAAVDDLPPLPSLPLRVCHGDLKLNNNPVCRDRSRLRPSRRLCS